MPTVTTSTEPRFDLSGDLTTEPDDGHRHGHAGSSQTYTLPALLQLTRSSVTAQRVAAWTVLGPIYGGPNRSLDVARTHRGDVLSLAITATGRSERSISVASAALSVLELRDKDRAFPVELIGPLLVSFAHQLDAGILPRPRLLVILDLLRTLTADHVDTIVATPKLLEGVVRRFARVPWPSGDETDAPSPLAIALLDALVRSSKDAAREIVSRSADLIDPLLRYLAVPLEATGALIRAMLIALLRLWTSLGRYGLATQMRSSPGMDELLARVDRAATDDDDLGTAWDSLRAVWML